MTNAFTVHVTSYPHKIYSLPLFPKMSLTYHPPNVAGHVPAGCSRANAVEVG